MAHGYAMVSGKPQAVMVHVIVGAANALGGLINAARSQVPILFTAGRTPITEGGMLGSRDRPIHWAQEAFDQGGMAREFVKWDYELRNFAQLETVVDRALPSPAATPGTVYLTLPRAVLAEPHGPSSMPIRRAWRPIAPSSRRRRIARPRAALAAPVNPIIITRRPAATRARCCPGRPRGALGAPVFEDPARTYLNFPQDHPPRGLRRGPASGHRDAVTSSRRRPGSPHSAIPRPTRRSSRSATRSTLAITCAGSHRGALAGAPRLTLAALTAALKPLMNAKVVAERRRKWEAEAVEQRDAVATRARAVSGDSPIDMAWASRCVADCIDDNTIVVNEYDLDSSQTRMRVPWSYFGSSPAGGLAGPGRRARGPACPRRARP